METDSQRRANDATLTEAHVVRLLSIEDRADWGGGLELRKDGVYRRDWTDDELRLLSPGEFAAVVGSGRGRMLLRLPCTLDELEAFASAECLLDSFIARRLHLLRVVTRPPALAALPPRTPLMQTNRERVLLALRTAGFDPLVLPSPPKGAACPAKSAARTGAGLSTASFDHAWKALMNAGEVARLP